MAVRSHRESSLPIAVFLTGLVACWFWKVGGIPYGLRDPSTIGVRGCIEGTEIPTPAALWYSLSQLHPPQAYVVTRFVEVGSNSEELGFDWLLGEYEESPGATPPDASADRPSP